MNKYSHGVFIECIYLQAPFCGANAHTDAGQRKIKQAPGDKKNNFPLKLRPPDKKED